MLMTQVTEAAQDVIDRDVTEGKLPG